MTIWGNHSATQYPDLFRAQVKGKIAAELINDQAWIDGDVHAHRAAARRGDHRGAGAVERGVGAPRRHRPRAHMGERHARGDWVSMAIPSDGSYDVPDGLMSSFPVTTSGGSYSIVGGLDLDDYSRGKIDARWRS